MPRKPYDQLSPSYRRRLAGFGETHGVSPRVVHDHLGLTRIMRRGIPRLRRDLTLRAWYRLWEQQIAAGLIPVLPSNRDTAYQARHFALRWVDIENYLAPVDHLIADGYVFVVPHKVRTRRPGRPELWGWDIYFHDTGHGRETPEQPEVLTR